MAEVVWIPAFAGMTKIKTYSCKPIKGEGIYRSRFVPDFGALAWFANPASLSESGFSGLAGFSGFHFAQRAVFAITGNPAKTNADENLPIKDELAES